MKIKTKGVQFFLSALAIFALPFIANAAPKNLIVHAEVISVPKATAAAVISSPEIKSNVAGVVAKLRDLVARKQATPIANPSVHVTLGGGWARTDGRVVLQVQASDPNDKGIAVTVHINYGGHTIDATPRANPGDTIYLGSLDPVKDSSQASELGTCLVFIHIQ